MPAPLAQVLERNKVIWHELEKRGLKPGTSFGIDFEFIATGPEQRDLLLPFLNAHGMKVETHQKRFMLVFKEWHLKATEEAVWTLESLQQRTEEVYLEASKADILFQGLRMPLPDGNA